MSTLDKMQINWHDYFTYSPETGDLLHAEDRPLSHFRDIGRYRCWKKRYAGKVTGRKAFRADGQPLGIIVKAGGRNRCAHRIIWSITNGEIPPKMLIDHINANPFDNRLSNLRLATHKQNNANRKYSPSRNPSGLIGVRRLEGGGWYAVIKGGGKYVHLGRHLTKGLAAAAYAKAALRHYGEYARIGNRSMAPYFRNKIA